jgi:hypothetical protein
MSKVSNIYDRCLVVLGELYPEHTRIPYAYSLENNNENFLTKGYGLRVGSANFEELDWCKFTVQRNITVVFTREVYRLDASVEEIDQYTKELLEDVFICQRKFFNYDQLGIEADIVRVEISGSTEISEVLSGQKRFLTMECDFNFSIRESFKE